MNKNTEVKRKRGGQPFNRNAVKHGIYSQFTGIHEAARKRDAKPALLQNKRLVFED